ncbi:aldo/keto reductase [Aquabacterium humicola]|uniref:aldo/keto reductase n=1 Tax=Aquabacterium humicola TaxID=3237377 RepID=UPI002543BC4B|nr:aldo/keto reductase [Rubrivivax pictus]
MNHLLSNIVAGAWRMADWQLDPQQRLRWIEQNVELGITSFDHADIYGGYQVETLFGEALALQPSLRHQIQIVTKCGIRLRSDARPENGFHCYDTSAAHVRASVEHSLRALRTDHVDLLLIHRPDALMDASELADTFHALRREGKVHHFGVSNFMPWQLELLHARCPLVTNQVELSPLKLDVLHDGTLDQCQRLGLRPMIWSPLAQGRIFTGDDDAARRVRVELQRQADELGTTITTLVFAWLLRHPSRPLPILGSRRLEAAREAVAALDLRLDNQRWYRIWTAAAGHEVP